LLALDLEDLSFSHGSVSESDIDDFGVLGELDVVEHDKWSLDVEDGSIVDSGGDVVIVGGCFDVVQMERHGYLIKTTL